MATYLLTPRARADLDSIWAYSLEIWGPARAEAYVRDMARAFEDLASGAAIGRRAEDVRAGYFRYPVGAHVLFYQCPAGRPLVIVRILHQRMDLPRHV